MAGYFNTQIENVSLSFCVTIMKWSPHPIPLPYLRRNGFVQAGPRGEGRVRGAPMAGLEAFQLKIGLESVRNKTSYHNFI